MKKDCYQRTLFEDIKTEVERPQKKEIIVNLTEEMIAKYKNYSLENYVKDVETDGLEYTWAFICEYVLKFGENEDFLNVKNFGEMYEIGLAIQDKQQKKNNGQYYTPDDVALIMSQWLDSLEGNLSKLK